jgi:hypothetical protein
LKLFCKLPCSGVTGLRSDAATAKRRSVHSWLPWTLFIFILINIWYFVTLYLLLLVREGFLQLSILNSSSWKWVLNRGWDTVQKPAVSIKAKETTLPSSSSNMVDSKVFAYLSHCHLSLSDCLQAGWYQIYLPGGRATTNLPHELTSSNGWTEAREVPKIIYFPRS